MEPHLSVQVAGRDLREAVGHHAQDGLGLRLQEGRHEGEEQECSGVQRHGDTQTELLSCTIYICLMRH